MQEPRWFPYALVMFTEPGAKVFYTFLERASLLGLLHFLMREHRDDWMLWPLALITILGGLALVGPATVKLLYWCKLRLPPRVALPASLLLSALLALGASMVSLAVGITLSRAFN